MTGDAHGFLTGTIYPALGKYELAVDEGRKTIELNPDFAIAYGNLSLSYQALNRLGEAEDTLKRAAAGKVDRVDMVVLRYGIAFLRRDLAEMDRLGDLGRKNAGSEDSMSNYESFALGYSGRLQRANAKSRQAVDVARQGARIERAALFQTGAALRQALFGRASAARHSAGAALDLSKAGEVQYGAAFALAVAGDASRSERLANDLERRFPENTLVRFNYLPVIRARLALARRDPARALELLQSASHYELGFPRSAAIGSFGALYPVYVRGEAYLATRQGVEAAAEFRKILDHGGIVGADPIGALARLQLARALALTGDRSKALTAYQDFLTLWQNADADVPIFVRAKAEYARLQ